MIELNHGIRVIGTELWLDATRSRPLGFISHAHSDHTAKHQQIIATQATWFLCRRRLGQKRKVTILEYRKPYPVDGYSVELLPSGHMLGAAQIMIQNGQRIVYTGDFRLKPGYTTEGAATTNCDVLIMECTFGSPRYSFPPMEVVEQRLIGFIEASFEDHKIPVLLAYQMGKSQEALKFLGDRGYTVCLPKQIMDNVKVYEECGVRFNNYEPFSLGNLFGKVVVIPPYLNRTRMMEKIPHCRTAFLSGWAMDSDAQSRFGVDEVIPMSDHADFNELVEYVEKTRPSRVYTVHGGPDFAQHLRKRGFHAEHLASGTQIALW
jgi:Cft2 family RNA processing exonuclease